MDRPHILLTVVIRTLILFPGIASMKTDKEKLQGTDGLTLYHRNLTWEEAFTFCQGMDDSLAVPQTYEYSSVQNAIRNQERVWVGQYTYTTPWMYPTGCFTATKPSKRIEDNDIATCKRFCGDMDVMLNIYNCLCVTEAPGISTRTNSSLCNTRCPGNRDDVCGGENVYQHYATYADTKEDSDRGNCGMLEKHLNQSFSIVARHCDIKNTYLCALFLNADDNKTSGVPFYIPKYDNGSLQFLTYQEALDSCANNGTYLADPTKLQASQLNLGKSTQYWIGARRRTTYVTSVKELPKNAEDQKCLYMVKGSKGVSKDRAKDCSATESVLCRKHMKGESTMVSIASTTVGIVTSPTSAITGYPFTNGTSPTFVISERTGSTTDPVKPDPPATGTDLWPYIGGGAGFFIVVIIILTIVIIRLTRRRRDKAKLHADVIPLDTHNNDSRDIMVADNPEETIGRGDCRHANQAASAECVVCGTGSKLKDTNITDSGKDETKLLMNLNSSSDFTKSVQRRDSNDKRSNDDLYDLADNSEGVVSFSSSLQDRSLSCESQTRKRGPYDYVQTSRSGWVRDPKAESVGNDTYNELHATRTSHAENSDNMYDHANTVSNDECYHNLTKPGYRHREEDLSAYDSTQNTLDSDVYNTLSNKGSKVNGNDTYNPYVDTQIDPLP
ncbi:uncharacterized protein LOC110441459 [Mizuhopecten yessoensis]|uniref:WSC domain-containing protein n=1 Tax=Mizuhopecten yessoensis TaxID=6573 RepID=A0A210R168_MIZYE|nr:uncharacterized protein LOC110441459 [Mizuhopecten yessoensis]OWF54714.1 hypothetical protein KP79_PYT05033 [Mizuhopecten yessoensis]